MSDEFVWSGPAFGSWDVASNWTDTTTSQDPATRPPGSADDVTINSAGSDVTQVITGPGSSAYLTINGNTSLEGAFSTGGLSVASAANLALGSGDTLSVDGAATVASGADITVSGGVFTVSGTLGGGRLDSQSGGSVQVAALSDTDATVDANSTFEVGTAGGAKTGVFTVDSGATVTSAGISGPTVSNAGTITGGGISATEVDNTGSIFGAQFQGLGEDGDISFNNSGTITLTGQWLPGPIVDNGVVVADASTTGLNNMVGGVTGTGQLQIAAGGNLTVNDVGAGITVAFTGSSGSLIISPDTTSGDTILPFQITGFSADDVIAYGGAATGAVYHANTGVLSLMNGGTEVAELHLTGNYSGDTFSVGAQGGSTLIALNGGADTSTPPDGTTTPDQYLWSGPAVGSWDAAANWTDSSTSSTPAAVAPGVHDSVTINSSASGTTQVVTGVGDSAELTIGGNVNLSGKFSTGSLNVTTHALTVQSSASLAVGGDASSVGQVTVSGGVFTAARTFSGGDLTSQSGGTVQVGALNDVSVGVDASSVFEVGTAGGAKAGAFTVDAGATVTSSGGGAATITNAGTITGGGEGVFYTNQVNNTGTISGMNFHAYGEDGNFGVSNSGTITLTGDWLPGSVVDDGVVIADPSTTGLSNLIGSVTGTGQVQIAGGGILSTGTVGSGITVDFAGAAGSLDISSSSLDSAKTYDAKIAGFAAGDVIDYAGKATQATYNSSNGVLSLANGSTVVAKLHLTGNYTGATFSTTTLSGGATLIAVGGGGDTSTPPAGTSTPDQYLWSGASPGSWDVAANWTDTSTSSNPAAVAPGVHDIVTINSGTSGLPQVITGTGNSAELTIGGDTTLAGKFSTGELDVASSGNGLTVQSKASLTVSGNATANGGLDAAGGAIKIAGTLTGGVSASSGGTVQVGALSGGAEVDSASSVEVGTKGGAKAGAFTVDAGATATLGGVDAGVVVNHGTMTNTASNSIVYANTVTNTGSIAGLTFHALGEDGNMSFNNSGTIALTGDWLPGSIVNNGVVIADASITGLDNMIGPVTGKGQIEIANGGGIATSTVASGNTVVFEGSSGSLGVSSAALDSAKTYDAKITGFQAGDVIDYTGAVTSVTYSSANAILSLHNGSTVVAKLHVTGNYSGDTFLVSSNDGVAQITVDPPAPAAHFAFHFPDGVGGQAQTPASVPDVVSGASDGASGALMTSDVVGTVAPLGEPSVHILTDAQLLHLQLHAAAATDFML